MVRQYKAIIRGDRLEWIDQPPVLGAAASVTITVDDGDDIQTKTRQPGDRTVLNILENLAEDGGIKGIPDPVAWQREIRRDRELPGRDSS